MKKIKELTDNYIASINGEWSEISGRLTVLERKNANLNKKVEEILQGHKNLKKSHDFAHAKADFIRRKVIEKLGIAEFLELVNTVDAPSFDGKRWVDSGRLDESRW